MTTEFPSTNINIMEALLVSPEILLSGLQFVLPDNVNLNDNTFTWRTLDHLRQLRILRRTKTKAIEIAIRVSGDVHTDYGATAIFKYSPEICFYGFCINSEGNDYIITDDEIIVYNYVFHEYSTPIAVDFTSDRDKEELDFYVQIMNLPLDERMKNFIMHKERFKLNNFPALKEMLQALQST